MIYTFQPSTYCSMSNTSGTSFNSSRSCPNYYGHWLSASSNLRSVKCHSALLNLEQWYFFILNLYQGLWWQQSTYTCDSFSSGFVLTDCCRHHFLTCIHSTCKNCFPSLVCCLMVINWQPTTTLRSHISHECFVMPYVQLHMHHLASKHANGLCIQT